MKFNRERMPSNFFLLCSRQCSFGRGYGIEHSVPVIDIMIDLKALLALPCNMQCYHADLNVVVIMKELAQFF